jgi:hypothetical protein
LTWERVGSSEVEPVEPGVLVEQLHLELDDEVMVPVDQALQNHQTPLTVLLVVIIIIIP